MNQFENLANVPTQLKNREHSDANKLPIKVG